MSYLALECPWVNFSRQQGAGAAVCWMRILLGAYTTPHSPLGWSHGNSGAEGTFLAFSLGYCQPKKVRLGRLLHPRRLHVSRRPPYTSPAECHWGWTKPTSTAPLMQLQGNSGMKSMPHVPVVCSGYYRPTTPRPPLQYAPCSLSHMQRGTKRVARICMWRPRTPATATILF